jgi:hypothetical protein
VLPAIWNPLPSHEPKHLVQHPYYPHAEIQRWIMSTSKVEDLHQGIFFRLNDLIYHKRLVTSVVDIVVHPDTIGPASRIVFSALLESFLIA